ncbi:Crp/Fnr family transcriptional regulator [Dyadobacter sp. 32]|uniref:Crp/Fnr family transcriptional regulator n=1 Tax=Dyadobacter sp. 32 TaxID=538966 RepID=UPI0011EE421D
MKDALIKFLSKIDSLTSGEIKELADLMTVKEIKKNTTIVKQGQICNLCYFVLKGCLRQYVVLEGVEKTTAFYTEEDAVNFFTSFTTKTASESYLIALEDSILLVGNPESEADMYKSFPKLEQVVRRMMEQDFGKTQDSFARFITSTPEERYLNLLKDRPQLAQRVPQHQLASYLGITPESLSRIRKRIITK